MQRLKLEITDQKIEREKGYVIYSLRANGIKFEQRLKEEERTPENIKKLNSSFRNSILIVKHHAGYVPDGTDEKDMYGLLNNLSSTNIGIGIRVKDDPLPEFKPF
jgi:hypothetical protein